MTLASIIWSVPSAIGLAYAPTFIRVAVISRFGGKLDNSQPRNSEAQIASLPKNIQDLTVRLKNAHNNQLETLGVFAGGVAICLAVEVPHDTLLRLTSYYLKSRLAFTLAYAAPQVANGAFRSLSFIASITSIILLFSAAANTVSGEQN